MHRSGWIPNIAWFALVCVAMSMSARADTQVGGLIERDQLWSFEGSPYIVTSNILIASGATVRIEPGVQVLVTNRMYIRVEGALIAIGTDDRPIRFTSGKFPQAPQDWQGIQVRAGGGTVFDSLNNPIGGTIFKRVEFLFATVAINVQRSGLVVDSCRFEENLVCISPTATRHLFVRGNRFTMNWGPIIETANADPADELFDTRFLGNHIENERNGKVGLGNRMAYVEVAHNRFRNSTYGISVSGEIPYDVQSVHIHHNIIEQSTSPLSVYIVVTQGSDNLSFAHVVVENNIVAGSNYVGIAVYGLPLARIMVRNNTFADCETAVLSKNNGLRVYRANTIIRCGMGMNLAGEHVNSDPPIDISENTFAYSRGEMVSINWQARATISSNDFLQTPNDELSRLDTIAVRNNNVDDLDLRRNYWGPGADSSHVARRVFDYYDNFDLGRARFMPMNDRGSFEGPLVPPYNVRALGSEWPNSTVGGQFVVSWSRSPDPRVEGYRVWFDTVADGHLVRSSIDVTDTTAVIVPTRSNDNDLPAIAVTTFRNDAKGEIEQLAGNESWFAYAEVSILLGVDDERTSRSLVVSNAAPNPASSGTMLILSASNGQRVSVDIVSSTGAHVWSFDPIDAQPGRTHITWDGTDAFGTPVANGVYWIRVTSGATIATRAVVIAR